MRLKKAAFSRISAIVGSTRCCSRSTSRRRGSRRPRRSRRGTRRARTGGVVEPVARTCRALATTNDGTESMKSDVAVRPVGRLYSGRGPGAEDHTDHDAHQRAEGDQPQTDPDAPAHSSLTLPPSGTAPVPVQHDPRQPGPVALQHRHLVVEVVRPQGLLHDHRVQRWVPTWYSERGFSWVAARKYVRSPPRTAGRRSSTAVAPRIHPLRSWTSFSPRPGSGVPLLGRSFRNNY